MALFALVSKVLYHDLLYRHAAALPVHPVATRGCCGIHPPRADLLHGRDVAGPQQGAQSESLGVAASRIAGLYGWNTLGAAMGAWVGSAVLVRSFGYESQPLDRRIRESGVRRCNPVATPHAGDTAAPRPAILPVAHDAGTEHPGWSWRLWLAIYFLSGFVALGFEMVWFRLLGVVLKSTAFTFPLLLGIYLAGVGGGSLIGRSIAHRTRHPVRWFLLAQAGVPLYAGFQSACCSGPSRLWRASKRRAPTSGRTSRLSSRSISSS